MDCLLNRNIKDSVSLNSELDSWNGEKLLENANNFLQMFIGANFTGFIELESDMRRVIDGEFSFLTELSRKELSFDYNKPFKFARLTELIYLSKLIILDRKQKIENTFERNHCVCRCVQLWQCLLEEPQIELKKIGDEAENEIFGGKQNEEVTSDFLLERMYAQLYYYEYDKAERYLTEAIQRANLTMHLTGVLGKRTRFQQTNIAQLITKASSSNEVKISEENKKDESLELPKNIRLDDETLLESVSIVNEDGVDSHDETALDFVQLACILARCAFEMSTQHNDAIAFEKASAYIDKVLSNKCNWAIQTSTLLRRCAIEKQNKRRVERACSQAELIAKLMDAIDDSSSRDAKQSRNALVLASGLSPSWRVQQLHAEILRSLGCTAEALRIYEKQESWDSVIQCYKSLGQIEKAEHLIRELIGKNPNEPLYYCLLGDITLEPNYYQQAIQISNEKCSRAFRSLGELMLIRHQYQIAYDNLRRSLDLQPIHLSAWFNTGHCAWKLENWRDAASAYHRCVQLEPEHFEAWNNLSAAYIRLGQKPRAKKILEEAIKFNYDHAKIWQNYLLLCVDTCSCADAIKALHRLLDLNEKFDDDEVIEIITQQIDQLDKSDEGATTSDQLKKEFCKLIARMTSKQTCSSKIWRCYASLVKPKTDDFSKETHQKYINLLERAYLADCNRQNWYSDEEKCSSVLKALIALCEQKLNFAKLNNTDRNLAVSGVRLSVRPILTTVEKVYGANGEDTSNDALKSAIAELKALMSNENL